MKYLRLIYSSEIKKNTVIIAEFFLVFCLILNWIITKKLKVYDYVIWGGGDLSRVISYYLNGKDVCLVIPDNKNVSITEIKSTEQKIISYFNFTEITEYNFPKITKDEITDLIDISGLTENEITAAQEKLLLECGERFNNCYYYRFDTKTTNCDTIKKHGIDCKIKNKLYFTDNTFIYCNNLIYADTGNLTDFISVLKNKEILNLYITVGYCSKTVKTNVIKFNTSDGVYSMLNGNNLFYYQTELFATGYLHNLKCKYNNDCFKKLMKSVSNLEVDSGKYILDSRCSCNITASDIICITPLNLKGTYYIRDFLILCNSLFNL